MRTGNLREIGVELGLGAASILGAVLLCCAALDWAGYGQFVISLVFR